jgi:hypothetical protein
LQLYIYAGLPDDTTQYTEHSQSQDTSSSTKHKSVYIVNDSSTVTTTTTQANVVNETSLISNDTQGADMMMKKSAKGGNLLLKDNHANVTLLKHTFTPPTTPIVDCSGDVSVSFHVLFVILNYLFF